MSEPQDIWLVWSHERDAWWKAGARGYTKAMVEAGRYDQRQAEHICREANYDLRFGGFPKESLVRAPEAHAIKITQQKEAPT